MKQTRPIPFVVCVDVEFDARVPPPGARATWSGFELITPLLGKARQVLTDASGQPARFAWFVRMDPQVGTLSGSAEYPGVHFADRLERLREAGDALGLHVHSTKLTPGTTYWTIETEQTWVEHCLRVGFDAFRRSFGTTPAAFRFGDGWMSNRAFDILEAEGVPIDVTLRPGFRTPRLPPTEERVTGEPLDYTGMPATPYQPSRRDFRRPDPADARSIWAIPETTAPNALVWTTGLRGTIRRLLGRVPPDAIDPTALQLDLGLPPDVFAAILDYNLERSPEVVVAVARSHIAARFRLALNLKANLAALARRARGNFVFETPAGALVRVRPDAVAPA